MKNQNQKGISSLLGIGIVLMVAIMVGIGTYVSCTYYFAVDAQPIPVIKTQNEFLKVVSPRPNQIIENPVQVSGESSFFEGNTRIRIKDNDNNILVDTFTTATGGEMGELSPFFEDITYQNPTTEKGFVEVFEESAKDGSEIHKITIPVVFENDVDRTVDLSKKELDKETEKTRNEMTDWKIYQNEKHNYKISYPSNWEIISKSDDFLYFYDPRTQMNNWEIPSSFIMVAIDVGKIAKESIYEHINFLKKSGIIENSIEVESTEINGNQAVKFQEEIKSGTTLIARTVNYYIEAKTNKGNVYKIHSLDSVVGDYDSHGKYSKILDKIVSTFRFID